MAMLTVLSYQSISSISSRTSAKKELNFNEAPSYKMNATIQQIIDDLQLEAHPEGGFFIETYRSTEVLVNQDRNLMTSIYFLLTSDNVSKFHQIKSDEMWYFHSGSPLVVHMLNEKGHEELIIGNDLKKGQRPYGMVPKDTIFGSCVLEENSYSLVSCAVAPGFDFRDFKLYTKEELMQDYAAFENIIDKLT
jgi:predicted cupin superfamily sugar epimerase